MHRHPLVFARTAVAAAMIAGFSGLAAAAGPLDLSSGSTSFGGTPAAGGFIENWTFTLSVASILSGSVTAAVSGTQDVDFSYIGVVGPAGVYSFTSLLGDPFETWGLASVQVPAGSYTLTMVGTNSPSVGSYAGNLGVTPVPEPETYAMLMAGLLAIGWKLQRRSNR